MNIVVLMPTMTGGGTERTVINLIENLRLREDINIKLLLVSHEGVLMNQIPGEFISHPNTNLNSHPILKFFRFIFKVWPYHIRFIRKFNPQVLMTTTEWMNDYGLLLKPFLPENTRWVLRTGQNKIDIARMKRFPINMVLQGISKMAYRRADQVIASCHSLGEEVMTGFGLKTSPRVIYNPVEIAKIKLGLEAKSTKIYSKDYIVAVGRLERQKNFGFLIDGYAKSNLPLRNIHLLILGAGAQERALKTQSEKLGVNDKVIFLGFIENPYPYIRDSQSLVLTSTYEGFAHVIAEALVCDTPVISSNCRFGPAEILKDGALGELFELGDVDRFTSLLNNIPENKKSLSPDLERFEAEKIANQYLDVFRSAIEN